MKRHIRNKILRLSLIASTLFFLIKPVYAQIDASILRRHVQKLSGDEMEGRGTGEPGEAEARGYIASEFKRYGLAAYGNDKGFLQKFEFRPRNGNNPHAAIDTAQPARTAYNVVAYLDNGAENTIIIGAHYDHLGLGRQGGLGRHEAAQRLRTRFAARESPLIWFVSLSRRHGNGTGKSSRTVRMSPALLNATPNFATLSTGRKETWTEASASGWGALKPGPWSRCGGVHEGCFPRKCRLTKNGGLRERDHFATACGASKSGKTGRTTLDCLSHSPGSFGRNGSSAGCAANLLGPC